MKKLFFIIIASFCSLNIFGQWTQLNSGTTQSLNAIYFLNSDTGFVGGNAGITSTTLLKTTDGGVNWISPNISTVNSIRSIQFTNATNGFLTTSSPSEGFKTIDGGNNWTYINTAIYNNGDAYFKDNDTGFVFSPNNGDDVSYTFDGGLTWTHYPNGTFNGVAISSIHFPYSNSNVGFAIAAWSGRIFKTINSGVTWAQISQPTSQNLNDVFFSSTNDGYIIGSNFILKTIDGGANWTTANSSMGGNKIKLVGSNLYLLKNDSIRISTNSGASFIAMIGTLSGLSNLHLLSSTSGYCVGGSGRIFKLSSSTSINESLFALTPIKVYPNPAFSSNTLNLEIPSNVSLSKVIFYDINGQEIERFNTTGKSNKLNFSINELPSGIYYFKLLTDDGNIIQGNKIVIIK